MKKTREEFGVKRKRETLWRYQREGKGKFNGRQGKVEHWVMTSFRVM